MMSAENRTPFERWCRVQGTRCDWSMRRIEEGLSDEEIAERLKNSALKQKGCGQNRDTDAATISVYRKALNGTLTEASGEAYRTDTKVAEALAYKMREAGKTNAAIAAALGLTQNQVGHYFRTKRKRSKKKAPENTRGGVTPQSPAVTAPLAGEPSILRELGMDEAEAARLLMRYGSAETRGKVIDLLMDILKEETENERGHDDEERRG